ncbi:MAG TPA: hypothetical protein VF040_19495 [Ktedonobacterales bacterium]
MQDDGTGDVLNQVSRPIREDPRRTSFLTRVQGTIAILGLLALVATHFLPHEIGASISSVLLNAMVIVFIGALPFLEVFMWKLSKELPREGYWGYLLLLAGWGIGVPAGAIIVFFATFLPAFSPPLPIVMILAVVIGGACASVGLGLLIVFAQIIREMVRLFRDRRHVRLGNEG